MTIGEKQISELQAENAALKAEVARLKKWNIAIHGIFQRSHTKFSCQRWGVGARPLGHLRSAAGEKALGERQNLSLARGVARWSRRRKPAAATAAWLFAAAEKRSDDLLQATLV